MWRTSPQVEWIFAVTFGTLVAFGTLALVYGLMSRPDVFVAYMTTAPANAGDAWERLTYIVMGAACLVLAGLALLVASIDILARLRGERTLLSAAEWAAFIVAVATGAFFFASVIRS